MSKLQLFHGCCLDKLPAIIDQSVDSVVTDPPYELGFMGKKWDSSGIAYNVQVWRECLRVLKPGGHLLAFGGSRTYHRLACAIEDAGFEIRDCIMWVYGSGFPKSLDVSKAIDKAAGAERTEVIGIKPGHEGFANRGNMSSVQSLKGTLGGEGGFSRPWMDDPEAVERYHQQFAPATDAARQWQGWGTALKPAHEPIVVARKPLIGNVAENVLAHGTGALNIDGCRVPHGGESLNGGRISTKAEGWDRPWKHDADAVARAHARGAENIARAEALGRWPANLIHDGSDEVVELFPGANGSSASRFFYTAKTPKSERQGSKHPTIKPLSLIRYLCRLVTPPGGTVLDPFLGSGTTAVAALLEGLSAIGIEKEEEYLRDARSRVKRRDSLDK